MVTHQLLQLPEDLFWQTLQNPLTILLKGNHVADFEEEARKNEIVAIYIHIVLF
jgi:hypothetical protein